MQYFFHWTIQSLLPGSKRHQSSSTNQSYLECPMNRLFEFYEIGFPLMVKLIHQKFNIMNLKSLVTIRM